MNAKEVKKWFFFLNRYFLQVPPSKLCVTPSWLFFLYFQVRYIILLLFITAQWFTMFTAIYSNTAFLYFKYVCLFSKWCMLFKICLQSNSKQVPLEQCIISCLLGYWFSELVLTKRQCLIMLKWMLLYIVYPKMKKLYLYYINVRLSNEFLMN